MIECSARPYRLEGFTTLELVITLLVFAVVAMMGATLISSGFRTYFFGREVAQDNAQGRLALERMARELRTIRSPADLTISVANQVSFTDLDGNAFTYRRNAATSQLERSQTGVAGPYLALADNVSVLTISYLQNDGVTTAATPGSVYYVTVQLTIQTTNVNVTYRNTVKPATF